ncbi:EAL domain-containing protein [Sulfurimonas sp. SAG-AH-194-C21]|nr:EAL domain-containing protein [Sulfurimonas sp. SAG-AH-194-C21]MDF1883983.1 EAL domain-containing protein [Sulfurimonas sp. SAG-AH-194-C21]
MDNFVFADEDDIPQHKQDKSYKLLIVDDEEAIHSITKTALESMDFSDYRIEVLSAYSAKEAKELLKQNPDVALAIIDVVMETRDAGLTLVDYIRNTLECRMMRLVIRTGQADTFPSMQIIKRYDINDFKEKTEFTVEKLYITMRSAIREYSQLLELEQKYLNTYHQMTTNQLTQLPNRTKLYEDFSHNKSATLILIDIVGFSIINETNGYEVGDYVLKELGGFLQSMHHEEFTVYHLDSDLFALMTMHMPLDTVITKVEQIKDEISKLHIITNNFNKTIDTTIGVAFQSEIDLMQKAELALKEARHTGKNQIKYYSDDLRVIKRLNNTNHWAPIIKESLLDGSLVAYYQPICHTQTKVIEKHEMLVRIIKDGKVHSPFEFLDAAQDSGQLYDIFKYMFTQACIQSAKTGKKFSVNISNLEFAQETLLPFIKESVAKYGADVASLSLEILESSSINDYEAKAVIRSIHDFGISIVIDDFGVECSNFGQIENLPIDIIKIDGSFIKNLPTSKGSQIIVKTIKTFAQEKGVKLVAEFVCDEVVYNMVKDMGIEYVQGYYLSEPKAEI